MQLRAIPRCLTMLASIATVGCADKLETGYTPTRLSATTAQRRAYYAAPYSPEADAAGKDSGPDLRGKHTPGAGY